MEDGKWYGVRSYLHLFYEDCAGTTLSDDPEGPPVLCPHQSWPTLCWKVRWEEEQLVMSCGFREEVGLVNGKERDCVAS